MAKRISIRLDDVSLQELEYLRRRLGISPAVSRSQLIMEVISRYYLDEVEVVSEPRTDPPKLHGFLNCPDDCEHCADEPICDYSSSIDRFII